jgi:hypothetical protein
MKKVVAGFVLLCGLGVQAATWESSSVWGFTNLGDSSTNAVSVQGWYFANTRAGASQSINGINFTGLNVGAEASGSNSILSWSGAYGYDLWSFGWMLESARDAVSVGGISTTMSLSFEMAAGLDYVVEMVSLQGSDFGSPRYFDLAVDGVGLIDNYYVPNTSPYNNHVIIRGTSDGSIDLDFSVGSAGDTNPAISMITVAQVPEPASALLLAVGFGLLQLFRRRFSA